MFEKYKSGIFSDGIEQDMRDINNNFVKSIQEKLYEMGYSNSEINNCNGQNINQEREKESNSMAGHIYKMGGKYNVVSSNCDTVEQNDRAKPYSKIANGKEYMRECMEIIFKSGVTEKYFGYGLYYKLEDNSLQGYGAEHSWDGGIMPYIRITEILSIKISRVGA